LSQARQATEAQSAFGKVAKSPHPVKAWLIKVTCGACEVIEIQALIMIYLITELLGLLIMVALVGFAMGWLFRGLDERTKRRFRRKQ